MGAHIQKPRKVNVTGPLFFTVICPGCNKENLYTYFIKRIPKNFHFPCEECEKFIQTDFHNDVIQVLKGETE